ncbi:MAG: hypothetical protein ABSG86_10280 [Thermoguttaceae bacterium]
MNISSVLAGHPDVSALAKRGEPAGGGAATPAAAAAPATPTASSTAAMREILAQYDVTDISPSELSTMVQKLQQSGAISPQDAKELAAVRMDLEQAGVHPDESVNLVDFYRQRVQQAQQAAGNHPSAAQQQQLQTERQRLQWAEKFAAGHANPEDIGLSTTA